MTTATSHIAVGWTVWERLPESVDNDPNGRPRRGGTVIGYWDEESFDGDAKRRYQVLDFPGGRPRYTVLQAGELEADLTAPPNPYNLRGHASRLAATVARVAPKRLSATERHYLELAVRFLELARV